ATGTATARPGAAARAGLRPWPPPRRASARPVPRPRWSDTWPAGRRPGPWPAPSFPRRGRLGTPLRPFPLPPRRPPRARRPPRPCAVRDRIRRPRPARPATRWQWRGGARSLRLRLRLGFLPAGDGRLDRAGRDRVVAGFGALEHALGEHQAFGRLHQRVVDRHDQLAPADALHECGHLAVGGVVAAARGERIPALRDLAIGRAGEI